MNQRRPEEAMSDKERFTTRLLKLVPELFRQARIIVKRNGGTSDKMSSIKQDVDSILANPEQSYVWQRITDSVLNLVGSANGLKPEEVIRDATKDPAIMQQVTKTLRSQIVSRYT
jgi:hypothetical protein